MLLKVIYNIDKVEVIKIIDQKKYSKKIKNLRIDSGRTQKEIANIFNLTPAVISLYENGRRVPSPIIMQKYVVLFNKSVDEIFLLKHVTLSNRI